MSEQTQAAADKAAADVATAAQALKDKADVIALDLEVKEAQKRLDAARLAQQTATRPTITNFSGFVTDNPLGGPFTIYGENLGGTSPQNGVSINGHTAKVTAVRANTIKGIVPVDVKPGPITVKAGTATFQSKIGK